MCSAIMIVVRFVFARGTSGIMDASTTRNPSVPSTRHSGSTTDRGSSGAPIRHVPQACQNSWPSVSSHASSRLSSTKAVGLRPVVPTETAWTRSATAACCVNVKSRRTPSRRRMRSRSSDNRQESTCGSTSGSALARRRLPVEKHCITAAISPAWSRPQSPNPYRWVLQTTAYRCGLHQPGQRYSASTRDTSGHAARWLGRRA